MQLSIRQLRVVLIACALLLVVVLTAYIGYGRYRALMAYRSVLRHAGASFTHDTNGFTYSQSEQGKTVFTLHAARATQLGQGKWALHDADLTLYGRVTQRVDRVYSSEIEYDEQEGVARALGEVHMDLQAPTAIAGAKASPAGAASSEAAASAHAEALQPDASQIIHVRTRGLVYLRKLGVAATDQPVEFRYADLECTAVGAEFNSSQSTLRLLNDVVLQGQMKKIPVHLVAERADLDRDANIADLTRPVLDSQGRRGQADAARLTLRKDGSIQRLEATGHVLLSGGTQQVSADRLEGTLSPQAVPEVAHLLGRVTLTDTNPLRPTHGSAAQVDARFNAQGGPAEVVASGGAAVSLVDHAADARTQGAGLGRDMQGERMEASFAPGPRKSSARLTQLHASGAARARGQSAMTPAKGKPLLPGAPPLRLTEVAADDLRVAFVTGPNNRAEPRHLSGSGHTLLRQSAPLGELQSSTGDTLEMAFAEQPAVASSAHAGGELTLETALQTGHVSLRSQPAAEPSTNGAEPSANRGSPAPQITTATAERALYRNAEQQLTLTGEAHLVTASGSVNAPTVVLHQQTQDADASGGVLATLLGGGETAPAVPANPAPSANSTNPPRAAPVTHVLAATAHFVHATQLSEFRDSDAHPAQVWQEGSRVQAALLLFDGAHHTFSARPAGPGGLVHAVFISAPGTTPGAGAPTPGSAVRIASPRMDYSDLRREAVFAGGVAIEGSLGQVRGQRAVAFLTPASGPAASSPASSAAPRMAGSPASSPIGSPVSGSIERVVVSGEVDLQQPGREATGEQLLYTAASGDYVLTGTPARPPHVVDAQQGNVTGATLLFGAVGSTIVVAGEPGTRSKATRVRTETRVRTDAR